MEKISSPDRMMVVATILVEWVGHNQTPTPCKTPHRATLKMHKPMKLCQWRLFIFLSPTLQHWTLIMQTLSGKYSLVWLTTTINHCQRIFQHQLKKDRMPHNSSQPGSILGIAIAVLLEVANTRHASASTQTRSQQFNNCSRCFSSSHMLKGSSSLKPTYACEKKNIVLSVMEISFFGWACGSSWQQSMVQIAQIFGPWVRLIVLLVPH